MKSKILLVLSLLAVSCRTTSKEILVENRTGICETFILYNHVTNELKILKERKSCRRGINWVATPGKVDYLGNCIYHVIPEMVEEGGAFYLIHHKDTLEFFVLSPEVGFCIENFGCKATDRNTKIKLQVITSHEGLKLNSVKYGYFVYQNGKLQLSGDCDKEELPEEVQKLADRFKPGDYILLTNLGATFDENFTMEVDSVFNFFAMDKVHF